MTVFKVNNRPVAKTWNGLVNDLFNDLENNFTPAFNHAFAAAKVPVNISESENAYQLDILAPGRSKELFAVNVEKNILTISYEQANDAEKTANKNIRNEFVIGNFKRSFTLDEKVNAEAIEAGYENGVLKLTLPKKAEVKPEVKQITIR